MCWTSFKTIGHSSKILGPSQKTLRPSWCPTLVTCPKGIKVRLVIRAFCQGPECSEKYLLCQARNLRTFQKQTSEYSAQRRRLQKFINPTRQCADGWWREKQLKLGVCLFVQGHLKPNFRATSNVTGHESRHSSHFVRNYC